ncbi:SEL1-like repeat protein [Sphingobacterium spiritivorum]|uniref:SEL1-like repeat protein n=1 Tax=Sphingobacterium spiritivorum TaxID=258 RepID=UPI00191A2B53|nr:SEL1-like repeat protein [Sphingobacterium spiritivorum]QQT25352.1 SEL1-like repeat protein [Sphingobacterium spiritivorum]
MAHRIYTYNIDLKTRQNYPHYLGEWNYVIPELLFPLFSANPRSKGTRLYFDRESGIIALRQFYHLLAETYQLHHEKAYTEPVNTMFSFLENLPYDTFVMDATDVFNMSEEKHSNQSKDWVVEIREKTELYYKAIAEKDLSFLNDILVQSGHATFLDMLQYDWINYGLGYWNEEAYKESGAEVFEQNEYYGLKDNKGNILVNPVYDDIYNFTNEGVAVVMKDDLYGYLKDNGELIIPCQYEDAFDAFLIEEELFAIVINQGKSGLINLKTGNSSIPVQYTQLEELYRGLFNANTNGFYTLLNFKNEQIIPGQSDFPYEFQYPDLVLKKEKGSALRHYYTLPGIYMGAYPEDVLRNISDGYYWVEPNKFHKKISVLNPEGAVFKDEIDRIIVLDNYNSIAYLKNKAWYIYDIRHQVIRLGGEGVERIGIDSLNNYMPDVFIVTNQGANGLYDALQDRWLIPLSVENTKIEHCHMEFLRITQGTHMRYYDYKTGIMSQLYDYVCEAIDYQTQFLCLFAGDTMWTLDYDRQIKEVGNDQMGELHENNHALRGNDQRYFLDYYRSWTQLIGEGYESYFDQETLYLKASRFARSADMENAIRLYTLGAEQGSARMMFELGSIYTMDEQFENIPLGVTYYEQAAMEDFPAAWNDIGYLYQNGIGYPKDMERAMVAYQKAAELGNGLALANLGDLYFYGHVELDYDRALDYYRKAEKKRHPRVENMAEIYYQKKDYTNLLRYLRKDYGDTFSAIYYGILYDYGYGVKQNAKKSVENYEKAMSQGQYFYGLERLLYYYKNDPAYADPEKFKHWIAYAKEYDMEVSEEYK